MNTQNPNSPALLDQSNGLPKPSRARALVVGGGTMGADVALVLARAGCRTVVLAGKEFFGEPRRHLPTPFETPRPR
jgi:NADPH-dependent 2,4-dienoyl-CoA reductase/sulfur reductase-like enzyme